MDAIVERVQKILALGRRGGTEAEAAAAMAKAQELLEKHNLSLAEVDRAAPGATGRREELAAAGGMYHYQRELWQAVAQLNFCAYFRHGEYATRRGKRRWRSKHCFVGRVVNTRTTMAMGQYLEQTIERLCRDRLAARVEGWNVNGVTAQSQFYSTWAVSYREGIADRVIEKLQERHRRVLKDDEARAKRAAEAAGASTATALTLAGVAKQEEAANYDFRHGEGAWARREAARVEHRTTMAREKAEWEAEWARLQKEEPEEARRIEAEARRARRSYRPSYGRADPRDDRKYSGAYAEGRDAGAKVGIDRQSDDSRAGQRRLT